MLPGFWYVVEYPGRNETPSSLEQWLVGNAWSRRNFTHDLLPNSLSLLLIFEPDAHVPINEHAPAILINQNVSAADIAMENFGIPVSGTVS